MAFTTGLGQDRVNFLCISLVLGFRFALFLSAVTRVIKRTMSSE